MEEETEAGRVEGTDDRPRDRLRCVLLFVRRRRRCVCVCPPERGGKVDISESFLRKTGICVYMAWRARSQLIYVAFWPDVMVAPRKRVRVCTL